MEVENFSKVSNFGKVFNYPAPIAIGAGFFCFWIVLLLEKQDSLVVLNHAKPQKAQSFTNSLRLTVLARNFNNPAFPKAGFFISLAS